jgi:hypothetical protein
VEKLWTGGAFPVRPAITKFFFHAESTCARTFVGRFACFAKPRAYNSPSQLRRFRSPKTVAAIHRFNQSIAGRSYLIEASLVSQDRWRACIVRVPGVPTAMMPFYGRTPDEAAQQLSDWLTRAYEPAARPGGTV